MCNQTQPGRAPPDPPKTDPDPRPPDAPDPPSPQRLPRGRSNRAAAPGLAAGLQPRLRRPTPFTGARWLPPGGSTRCCRPAGQPPPCSRRGGGATAANPPSWRSMTGADSPTLGRICIPALLLDLHDAPMAGEALVSQLPGDGGSPRRHGMDAAPFTALHGCTYTPWTGLQCEVASDDARVLRSTRQSTSDEDPAPCCSFRAWRRRRRLPDMEVEGGDPSRGEEARCVLARKGPPVEALLNTDDY